MYPSLFLTAEWRHLLMVNYEVDPSVLIPYIPQGTELDLWNGKAFISLVGFMFLNTRVKGFAIPFHTDFEEVNLRFYVKKNSPEGVRRGVVFIKEIVPRWAIAFVANRLYNESYITLPMRHQIGKSPFRVEYQWKLGGKWQTMKAQAQGAPQLPENNSQGEFITEHYWGYTGRPHVKTLEYQVKHPPWSISETTGLEIDIDSEALYGPVFAPFLKKPPFSTFLIEGSEVSVFYGYKN